MTLGKFANHTTKECPLNTQPTSIIRHFVIGGTWRRVVRAATALTPAMSAHYGKGRTGCVMTLYEKVGDLSSFVREVSGTPNQRNIERLFMLSLEGAMRAEQHGQENSWSAERDVKSWQYGGAFKLPQLPVYASLVGWTEPDNVVYMTYVLYRAGVLNKDEANRILANHGAKALDLLKRFEEFTKTFELVPVT